MSECRELTEKLGGQRALAEQLGVVHTAVNNALKRGRFPSDWWPIVRDMCLEREIDCNEELFAFRKKAGGE